MASDPLDVLELINDHRAMLERSAQRLCGNAAAAEDLVQATLLRAIERKDLLKPGTNLAAWLVTILTNLYYDQRKHGAVEQRAIPQLTALQDDVFETPLLTISDAMLRDAVDALEADLRAVVELCYLQLLRRHEAARRLGVPAGTVATRLMRARERLRELLTAALAKRKP